MKIIIRIFLAITVGLISFSCNDNTVDAIAVMKLKSFKFNDNNVPISYDLQEKPIKLGFNTINYNNVNNISNLGAYTYNYNNGQLTEIINAPNFIQSSNNALLTYNTEGKIITETITFTNATTNVTNTFSRNFDYNSSGKLAEIIEERIEINGSTSLVKYQITYYGDGKINTIVRYRSLNNGTTYLEEETLTYHYDNNKNPFYHLLVNATGNINSLTFYQFIGIPTISLGFSSNIKLQYYSPNNIIRIEKSTPTNTTPVTIITNSYIYNQNGFPTYSSKKITQQSGEVTTEYWYWEYSFFFN